MIYTKFGSSWSNKSGDISFQLKMEKFNAVNGFSYWFIAILVVFNITVTWGVGGVFIRIQLFSHLHKRCRKDIPCVNLGAIDWIVLESPLLQSCRCSFLVPPSYGVYNKCSKFHHNISYRLHGRAPSHSKFNSSRHPEHLYIYNTMSNNR